MMPLVNENVPKLQIRSPENVYPIWVGEGMLQQTGAAMQECGLRQTDVGIVTNPADCCSIPVHTGR